MSDPTPLYPVPDGPGVESGPLATWRQQGIAHNTHAELERMRRRLEEMREAETLAYVTQCRRATERIQAENALTAARGLAAVPAPGRVPDPPVGPREEPVLDEADDPGEPVADDLASRAAALLRLAPDIARDRLQEILGCNSYQAKKFHEAARGAR